MDTTWFAKSFVRIVQEIVFKIFARYIFFILLAKHLASTTSRTLGGDLGCG
jgi:hypothetical protein